MYAWDFTIKMMPVAYYTCKLFSSRKYPYSPHRRDWNFLGGWGGSIRPKNLKKRMKLNRNFQRGGRGGYFLELHVA